MDILQEFTLTIEDVLHLNNAAVMASTYAHCPYSGAHMGAALLTTSHQIITACNFENRALICAEAICIAKANSMGYRQFKAISVYHKRKHMTAYPLPCGVCRQVMIEYGYFPVIACRSTTNYIIKTTSSLLPYATRLYTLHPNLFFPNYELQNVLESAHYYLNTDFYDKTRAEVEELIIHDNFNKLRELLCGRLIFEANGLNKKEGAGFANINFVTIQQIVQGICNFLLEWFGKEKCSVHGIVIGYDSVVSSRQYAHISAAVMIALGVKQIVMEYDCSPSTIECLVGKLHCLAGIMVGSVYSACKCVKYGICWTEQLQMNEFVVNKIKDCISKSMSLIDLSGHFDYLKLELKVNKFDDNKIIGYIPQNEKALNKDYYFPSISHYKIVLHL